MQHAVGSIGLLNEELEPPAYELVRSMMSLLGAEWHWSR
jgi:hypothetical protein